MQMLFVLHATTPYRNIRDLVPKVPNAVIGPPVNFIKFYDLTIKFDISFLNLLGSYLFDFLFSLLLHTNVLCLSAH